MATIQGVYVALFGRPADPNGLAYFNSVTNNGANLNAIGDLASTQEYKDRFAGQNNIQIITSIYQSLFNRDPEPAGLVFFVNALNSGTLNINNIAIAILDGAQGTDRTIVDTKIASANSFTAALDTPTEIAAYTGNNAAALGRAFLAPITTTPATAAQADTAVSGVVTAANAGNTTIALTAAGTDVVNTTSATATLKSTNFNDTITAATAGDWDETDTIDGGFGTDTIVATLGANFKVAADVGLKSVEVAFIKATTGAVAFDVVDAKDLTQVWNDDSVTALTVDNIALTQTAGLRGSIDETTTFNFAATTGTADSATLAINAASTLTGKAVTINAVETLTIANTGTSSIVGGIVGDALKSVVVTGTGSLSANFATAANTVVESINASGFTGKFTTDLTNLNAIKTFTGSTGADVVTIDGLHTNDVTINTGAGNDSVTLLAAGTESKALSVTLGAGSDTVTIERLGNVQDATSNAKLLQTLVTITDFNKSEDAIKVDVDNTTKLESLLQTEVNDINAATDLLGAVTVVAATTAVGNHAIFAYKGDTYIFENNGADIALNAGDTLVKITGVAVADLVATNFETF